MTTELETTLKAIAEAITQAGGRPFEVGGRVRDSLLGIASKDVDIEVFGMDADRLCRVLERFGKVNRVGVSFGVIKLRLADGTEWDFSLPRLDSKVGKGHRGFMVTVDPALDFEQAASRRDYTINAMARDCADGRLIDPFGGLRDLNDGILRATSERFAEDPLRVLRGFQLAGRFDLRVEPKTAALCRSLLPEYGSLASERIWGEWRKWAAKSRKPSRGLEFLVDTGWLTPYPELEALIGVPQNPEWHPEGDVWTHTRWVCDAAAEIAERERLAGEDRACLLLAALCHDLGKPGTTRLVEGVWVSRGHCEAGVPLARAFLERIGCLARLIEVIEPLVREHLVHLTGDASPRMVRRLSNRLGKATIRQLLWLIEADASGRPPIPKGLPQTAANIGEVAEALDLQLARPQPLVRGRHLIARGLEPGPAIGHILERCYQAQLDGEFEDPAGAQAFVEALLVAMGPGAPRPRGQKGS